MCCKMVSGAETARLWVTPYDHWHWPWQRAESGSSRAGPAPVPCRWRTLRALAVDLLFRPLSCPAHRHVGCGASQGPSHGAKGAFLIFTGMRTFPKSKGLGGFEEFPLEMKRGCLQA